MSKPTFVLLCFFVMIISSHVCFAQETKQLAGSKPNIVLVITDDQGYGPIGRHGHPWIKTPNLDKLYDMSLRFTRFHVSPTCAPTRAALMTGRHPMQNGVTHTINERERMALGATTLPQVLKTAGYKSGIFGKWHLGDEDAYQPGNRGFDEVFIHGAGGIGQAYKCSCADAPNNKYFDPTIRHNGRFVKTEGFCTDVFFNAALGWIKDVKASDEPFFAYISTNAPHGPFIAPPKNAKRFLDMGFVHYHAGFYGMVENIDENIGSLIDKLEEWDMMDDTIVIFMSDNGTAKGGAGLPGKAIGKDANGNDVLPFNDNMKGHKNSVEEGGVRVPFFVRWDKYSRVMADRDIDQLSAHIDILPTLAELAGANIPSDQVEGRSMLPLIQNDSNAKLKDRMLVSHIGRWKSGAEPNQHQWEDFAIRNNRYRLVGKELFDMQKDPAQTTDVASEHPELIKEMHQYYDSWWKKTRPLMVNETAPISETRPYHDAYQKQLEQGEIPKWRKRGL